jgi:heme oxygenase
LGIDFQERRKASLLEKDLVAVGTPPELVERCRWLPDASSLDRACGALYVMEGSTLGGQHISRMASQAHVDEKVLHYFKSYGARVGEMWKSLGEALNRFAEIGGDESEIVEGARDTFEALRAWFLCKPVAS